MKIKVIAIGLIILAALFIFGRNSFGEGVNVTVTQGDEASSPIPGDKPKPAPEPPPATQSSPTKVFGTVQGAKLSEESRVNYDTYRERKLGRQLNVQEIVGYTAAAPAEGGAKLAETSEAPVSKKKRVFSLAELQQELQEDKLILSKAIPLFLGGS